MAGGREFVVDCQPTEVVEPGEGALHDPAFGDRHKAAGRRRAAAQLVRPSAGAQVAREAAPVALVGDHRLQAPAPAQAGGQQRLGLRPVVAVGRVDAAGEDVALHVSDQLTFTPVHPFAAVRAPVLENARRQLDALAVHAHERGGGGPVGGQAVGPVHRLVEPDPGLVLLPAPKIVVDRRPGRETGRQTAPLTTRAADVAHGVNYLPQAQAAFALQGQQRGHNLPLRVSKELIAVNHNAKRSLGTPLATY